MQAALFDLDGTIVDTERQTGTALANALERAGYTLAGDERDFVVGHSWIEIHELLSRRHPGFAAQFALPALIETVARERAPLVAGLPALPGASELVRRLSARIPVGLVSGSSRAEIDQVLHPLGLLELFRVRLGAEDVGRGKPSPEGYLRAAALLGATPDGCLVVEDSAAGIAAARAAGMRCVAVRCANFAGHDQSAADLVVDTCHEITDEVIQRLWAKRASAC